MTAGRGQAMETAVRRSYTPLRDAVFGCCLGRLLVAGGFDGNGELSRVDVYDPISGRWTRCQDMPEARSRMAVAAVGGFAYVLGGHPVVADQCLLVFGPPRPRPPD